MGIMLGPSYIPNIPLSHGGGGVHQEHKLFGGLGWFISTASDLVPPQQDECIKLVGSRTLYPKP